jgi:hypothetical protein
MKETAAHLPAIRPLHEYWFLPLLQALGRYKRDSLQLGVYSLMVAHRGHFRGHDSDIAVSVSEAPGDRDCAFTAPIANRALPSIPA